MTLIKQENPNLGRAREVLKENLDRRVEVQRGHPNPGPGHQAMIPGVQEVALDSPEKVVQGLGREVAPGNPGSPGKVDPGQRAVQAMRHAIAESQEVVLDRPSLLEVAVMLPVGRDQEAPRLEEASRVLEGKI